MLGCQANLSNNSPLLRSGGREVSHPTRGGRWPLLFTPCKGDVASTKVCLDRCCCSPRKVHKECTDFAIGNPKETKLWGKRPSCLGLPDTLLILSQELLKTHSETFTVQALCIGENHLVWAAGKKKYSLQEWGKWTTLTSERKASSSCNVSSILSADKALHYAGWQRKRLKRPRSIFIELRQYVGHWHNASPKK